MNAFTFVTKQNKQSQPQNKIGSSILERLQQLKQSMRPSQPVQQQYESTNTNKNYGLNLSNIQNQRLKKYLPNEGQSKIKAHNEEGTQQFESYRKSLQKKLNSLFQKQKQIMKTQSTYEPSNKYHPYQQYKFEQKTNYPDQIQRKYNQFKAQQENNYQRQKSNTFFTRETKSFSNLNHYPNQMQRQPYQQREHKAFSTIQHVNFTMKSQNMRERKDQQIQQMQRKIKILEMKYLGNNNSQNQKDYYYKQSKHDNSNNQRNENNQNIGQNRQKSTKSRQKKYGTSPDNMETKMKNSHKQTIQSNYFVENNQQQQQEGNKNFLTKQSNIKRLKGSQIISNQKGKRKQRIKEYMNTIDNKSQSEETHNERQLLLQQQFKSLKLQFQTLMEINKSIIQKVQINEEERTRKKENKLRAKVMLKQILFRLEQIKYEMKSQHFHQDNNFIQNQTVHQKVKQNDIKKQNYNQTKLINKKRDAIFQKSSNFNNNIIRQLQSQSIKQKQKATLTKQKDTSTKLSPNKKTKKQQEPDINDIEKLKLLLDLQIQHRNIVQKKLQVIYGSKNATIQ